MAPSPRPDHQINLNYLPQFVQNQSRSGSSATSPVETPSNSSLRYPLGNGNGLNATNNPPPPPPNSARMASGSPSPSPHDFGRLYSKRAREIQAQEGVGPLWGPPTSGNSTPLRETIPESPNGESFPDFKSPSIDAAATQTSTRRARAGTLPSRFSPAGISGGVTTPGSLVPKTARPTPSTSPFKPGSGAPTEATGFTSSTPPPSAVGNSALLSRLRAGSLPQRASFMANNSSSNPFSSLLFSPNWPSGRDRGNTLASIQSSNGPSSPSQSSFSRDSLADTDVRTLDYLGLVDTPQPTRATLAPSDIELLLEEQRATLQPSTIADLASMTKNANRFRSYSVNAKEKYAEEDDAMDDMGQYSGSYSGSMTPNADAYAIHEAVRRHNLEVQAFANLASASRPRARTAGVLDTPTRLLRNYMPTSSRLDSSLTASDLQLPEESDYPGLAEAVRSLQLNGNVTTETGGDENILEGPTRALWLGNIPSSTTVSSLNAIFNHFGPIESTRVLTHKNCGFVNFENIDHAIRAKAQLNGKEIFPGAGAIRINYAKVPSASATPGHNGVFPSPSPDPHTKGQADGPAGGQAANTNGNRQGTGTRSASAAPIATPDIRAIRDDIIEIVKDLGATDDEQSRIASHVDVAIGLDNYEAEIPPVPEPSHNRVHDAPKLREIRKRIDNNSCSQQEIEDVAMGMLPEIAELSSDYLGNTVVQKLFEFCSEDVKVAMLKEIAPHMAEIGVHKNGTWAAQKIIDVAKSPALMKMVVESLRSYAVVLFLDQFGNYVIQGSLRYQAPLNNFIFEAMLTRLWELAQGRFGARAMRACLESHYATKGQQRMIAAAIALHSVQLATNANGALLLTWFLDTCTFPRRRSVLAPRLVPHLVHLCTHKVAYLTVLKIINQRNEPEARDKILQALFFSPNDQVLEDILSDQSCGATLIFKVLTTPFFDEKIRSEVVQNVRNVLVRIKAQPAHGYRRLMDEVGLSTRNGGPGARDSSSARDASPIPRPGSKQSITSSQAGPPQVDHQMSNNRQFFNPAAQAGYDPTMGLQRTGSMDSNGFDQVPFNGMAGPMYQSNPNMGMPPMTPQQMQYQQAVLASAARQGSFYPPMNGFPNPGTQMEGFRNVPGQGGVGASPMMPQSGYGTPGFGQVMGQPMYQYPMQFVPQQQTGGGRRGRR